MSALVAASLSVALSLSLATGPARDDQATARQLFDAGSLAYDRGRYLEATRAFEAAYEQLPDPAIAFSLAQSHRRQYFVDQQVAHLHRAIELFEAYLGRVATGRRRADAVEQLQSLQTIRATLPEPEGEDEAPAPVAATELMIYASAPGATASVDGGLAVAVPAIASVDPGPHHIVVEAPGYLPVDIEAAAAEGRLVPVQAELKVRPAHLKMRTRDGASVHVDGRLVGEAPLPSPVQLRPGRHEVRVSAPGRVTASNTVTFDRGQTRSFQVDLPPTVRRRVAWGLLGAGLGLTVAGGGTLAGALVYQRRARDIDAMRGEANIDVDQLDTLNASLDARDQLRGATIGLWSTAAVCGVVGLVLVLTDRAH